MKTPLEKLDPKAYGVKDAKAIAKGWERIVQRVDEYNRVCESRSWRSRDGGRMARLIEMFSVNVECCIEDVLAGRNDMLGLACDRDADGFVELFTTELCLPYTGVHMPDVESLDYEAMAGRPLGDSEKRELVERQLLGCELFPELEPEDFKAWTKAKSAVELMEDERFGRLAADLSSSYDFRIGDRLRLQEYDRRTELAQEIAKLFRYCAIKAKDMGRIEVAERLVDAMDASEMLTMLGYGDEGSTGRAREAARILSEGYAAFRRASVVHGLPGWAAVKSAVKRGKK